DLITSAKGLSSGYLPIGAVIAGPKVVEPFWSPGSSEVFRHGYTYSGHPAAAAVALPDLRPIQRGQLVPRGRADEAGPPKPGGAPLAQHRAVSEVRSGTGLLAAVEIAEDYRVADPTIGQRLVLAVRDRGVITRLLRGIALQISPPFVITEAEIGRIVDAFAGA